MSDIARKPIPKWAAVIIIFFAVAVMAGVVSRLTGGAPASTPTSPATVTAPADEPEPVKLPAYEIVETEDLTFGNTVRFQYRVRVAGEPSADELRAVVDDVVEKAKAGPAFNAISVGLYGEGEDVQQVYTLGFAELAPSGDWGAADTVDAGDYETMKLTVELY